MPAKGIELEPGEEIIDTWPLLYSSPQGISYEVRCTITNKRIMYASRPGIEELKKGIREWHVIIKDRIRNIDTKKSYLEKSVILTLDNGQKHEFSYGALNIDKIIEALKI